MNKHYFSFTEYLNDIENGMHIASYKTMKQSLVNMLEKALFVILLTFIMTVNADAATRQSESEIYTAVKQFVKQQNIPLKKVQVSITSMTKKKYLPQCNKPLTVSMVPGINLVGHSKFIVSCTTSSRWKINVSAYVDGMLDVLVAHHPIAQGRILQTTDLKYAERLNSQLSRGYYTSAKQLKQMEAKRSIQRGQVFTPGLLKAQKLVLRGQQITIVAQTGGLNLRVKGKALMDGQRGQTIKVRNLSSKKLVYARVKSSGIVEINF